MHPTDQISITGNDQDIPKSSSGARYNKVTTLGEYGLGIIEKLLANPKSAILIVSLLKLTYCSCLAKYCSV
jgi:hypothetical protein